MDSRCNVYKNTGVRFPQYQTRVCINIQVMNGRSIAEPLDDGSEGLTQGSIEPQAIRLVANGSLPIKGPRGKFMLIMFILSTCLS